MSDIASLLANYPQRIAQTQAFEAQAAHARAQIPLTQAEVPLTQARIPLVQQQAAQVELENQMKRRALRDQEIWQQAMTNTDRTPKAVGEYIMHNGGSPALFATHEQFVKTGLQLNEEQRKVENQITDQSNAALDAYLNAPPEKRAETWGMTRARLIQLHPEQAQTMPPDDPGEQAVKTWRNIGDYAQKLTSQQKTKADTAEVEQKVAQQKQQQAIQELSGVSDQASQDAWAARHPEMQKRLPGVYTPAAVASVMRQAVPVEKQPEYDITKRQEESMKGMTQEKWDAQVDSILNPRNDPKVATEHADLIAGTKNAVRSMVGSGAKRDTVDRFIKDAFDQVGRVQTAKLGAQNRLNINLGGLGGGPGQPSALATSVANYQVPFQTAVARLPPPAREALMQQVQELNPDYQASNFNTYQLTEKAFTSGQPATAANALNTMLGHLSVLDEAATALKNNDVQVLNRIANFVGVQAGQSPVTTFQTVVRRIGPEVTRAYVGSGGEASERIANEKDFDPKMSPEQLKQNIAISARLADSKINALQQQYERGTYGRGKQRLITDEAQRTRERLASQAKLGGAAGGTPAGTVREGRGGKRYRFKGGDESKRENWEEVKGGA